MRRSTTQRDKDRTRIARQRAACGICGEPIDYDLPYLHPRSFVADHVVPLLRGGKDHIGNKQGAHRECNAKKAARLDAPIVRRSGSLA